MAESSLSLQLADFAAEVGQYLGYGRTAANWTGWQALQPYVPSSPDTMLGQIMACIQSGYRRFLYPTVTEDGRPLAYEWSFLTPRRQLQIFVNVGVYDMPDDYRDMVGEFTYQPTDATWVTASEVGIGMIDNYLQLGQGQTGKPVKFAVYPKQSDGTQGQRWQVSFFPLPDANYTLNYRCSLHPVAMSATNPFPYGGMAHAETIKYACLAAAERDIQDDQSGAHMAEFMKCLAASISVDRELRPAFWGYNADRSDGQEDRYGPWGDWGWGTQSTGVTYNGAVIS